jgi:site-specific DNA-cytosine methylase
VVAGIDIWKPAIETHHLNGLGAGLEYDLMRLVGDGGYEAAQQLAKEIEDRYGRIDVLIGSPPCQEFSTSKRGGTGNLQKGMLLVRAMMVMVVALKPKFWLMENVPRLEQAIWKESAMRQDDGWLIELRKLGVDLDGHQDGYLNVPYGKVYTASDFGAPQHRRRFVAGNVNPRHVDLFRLDIKPLLCDILGSLERQWHSEGSSICDPYYTGHAIPKQELRDYGYDPYIHPMYWEEMRFYKRRHGMGGKLDFPDRTDRTARTVVATMSISSRESMIFAVDDQWGNPVTTEYHGRARPLCRHLRVREAACLQGFPISFQFAGENLTTRYRLIGNAVPCQLSYALAQAVLVSFEKHGTEDAKQEKRLEATDMYRTDNWASWIIPPQHQVPPEATDIYNTRTADFRARHNKPIRRIFLGSKAVGSSAKIVFENVMWRDSRTRQGGSWKSCIQAGTGKGLAQVFLDETSVRELLDAVDLEFTTPKGQTMLIDDRLDNARKIVEKFAMEIEKGIPLTCDDWVEFPGFGSEIPEECYSGADGRLPLPSVTRLQQLFTGNIKQTDGVISPIDLFDGLDVILLMTIHDSEYASFEIPVDGMVDKGDEFHGRRVSGMADNKIKGSLPLITILSGLFSVLVIDAMQKKDGILMDSIQKTIARAADMIRSWYDDN